jgi:hypothetical protein
MCDLTSDKDCMEHPWQGEIGQELALTGQQAAVFTSWH